MSNARLGLEALQGLQLLIQKHQDGDTSCLSTKCVPDMSRIALKRRFFLVGPHLKPRLIYQPTTFVLSRSFLLSGNEYGWPLRMQSQAVERLGVKIRT